MSSSSSQESNPAVVAANDKILYQSRIFAGLVGGALVGMHGVTGLYGFLLYPAVVWLPVLVAWAGSGATGGTRVWMSGAGVVQGLLSYIMLWTLTYDGVHIFY
eukprot:gb/GECH01014549.1/.p1 GENE.gb/GECH01014549.1/~~gb/GECH01014549.1/.p1  ORF type:complete len:103 (+),score=7.31 gb/GECH01014549.1/:1-309(+)